MSAGFAGALGTYGSNGAGFGGAAMNSGATGSLLSNGMHAQNMQQQQQQAQGSAAGGGSQTSGAPAGTSDNGAPPQPEYTLAGILHFLQSEWRRYERDRNEWEIERAEMRVSAECCVLLGRMCSQRYLQARIALLEGERRGVENLKTDLMRRVKMLEYALRQER
jgi:striatin 1/3/4